MNSQNNQDAMPCPCGSSSSYHNCCYRFISGQELANTAEQLMRSRFSAYSVGEYQYVIDTYHPSSRPNISSQALAIEDSDTRWLALNVVESTDLGEQAYVCFKAFRETEQEFYCLHERSRFFRDSEGWLYIDGEIFEGSGRIKPGRNDSCICGSGKKFKRCCG